MKKHLLKIYLFSFFILFPSLASAGEIGSVQGVIKSAIPRDCTEAELTSDFAKTNQTTECYNLLIELNDKKEITIDHVVQSPIDIDAFPGAPVTLYTQTDQSGSTIYGVSDYNHKTGLILLLTFFLISILIIGGIKKGLKTILSLAVSLVIIFGIFIPLIIAGHSPLLLTFFAGGLITIITLIILNGFRQKTFIMTLGTLGGLGVALLFALIFGQISLLTGFGTEEVRNLAFLHPEFDYRGLLFAGIVLGALGAVMDTAVSITSSMLEIKKEVKKANFNKLWTSGMSVGRDIMGSMTNTLIFAYVGSAYAIILTFIILGQLTFGEIINLGFISEEIVRSLVGSLGLIFTIPITAFIGAFIISKQK